MAMSDFGAWWWWIGLAAAAGVLAFLNIIASAIRNGTAVHELKLRVHSLRLKYLAQMRAAEIGDNPHDLPDDIPSLQAYLKANTPDDVSEAEEPLAQAA